ncbi:MAG: hypothetical protein GXY36_06205 [Chloroflexi bacterium]|nr:hypothetical protein [Chloroflexota bacterium]
MLHDDAPETERKSSGTYQMLWDCRFCGTERLLGVTHRHCPSCGAAQDPTWRYFPAEKDMIAVADHKYVGADKICPACSQPNSAASTYCTECGADLATGQVVQTQAARDLGTGLAEADTRRDVVKDQFVAEMQRVDQVAKAQPVFMGLKKSHLIVLAVLVIIGIIVAGIIYALTYRKDVSGEIVAMGWERMVDIEIYGPVSDGSWQNSVPGDAYDKRCYDKKSGSRQVPSGSHEECRDVDMGDGSFQRQCTTVTDYRDEPVYDTWCDYKVNRWTYARTVSATGSTEADAPIWPQFSLATGNLGRERTGERREAYTVVIRDSEGKEHTCRFDDSEEWAAFDEGDSVALEVGLSGSADCDTLQPAS